jgi:hypothetical protein
MSNNDVILPTPEREAKGDLVEWKFTGRSVSARFQYDKLRDRGVINAEQWRYCDKMRRAWEAFKKPLDIKSMNYSSELRGASIEAIMVDHITQSDHYRTIVQQMPYKEQRVVVSVVCDDRPLRDTSRMIGRRYAATKDLFVDGVKWLGDYYG